MPESRKYVVEETREVEVVACSTTEALLKANTYFWEQPQQDTSGHPIGPVRTTDVVVREKY